MMKQYLGTNLRKIDKSLFGLSIQLGATLPAFYSGPAPPSIDPGNDIVKPNKYKTEIIANGQTNSSSSAFKHVKSLSSTNKQYIKFDSMRIFHSVPKIGWGGNNTVYSNTVLKKDPTNLNQIRQQVQRIDITQSVITNQLPFDVDIEIYAYVFKNLSTSTSLRDENVLKTDGWTKSLVGKIVAPANDIASLKLNDKVFNDLDTDGFILEAVPVAVVLDDMKAENVPVANVTVDDIKFDGMYKSEPFSKTVSPFRDNLTVTTSFVERVARETEIKIRKRYNIQDEPAPPTASVLASSANNEGNDIVVTSSNPNVVDNDAVDIVSVSPASDGAVTVELKDVDSNLTDWKITHHRIAALNSTRDEKHITSQESKAVDGVVTSIYNFSKAVEDGGVIKDVVQMGFGPDPYVDLRKAPKTNVAYSKLQDIPKVPINFFSIIEISPQYTTQHMFKGIHKNNLREAVYILNDTRHPTMPQRAFKLIFKRRFKEESHRHGEIPELEQLDSVACLELPMYGVLANDPLGKQLFEDGILPPSTDKGHYSYEIVVETFDYKEESLGQTKIVVNSEDEESFTSKFISQKDQYNREVGSSVHYVELTLPNAQILKVVSATIKRNSSDEAADVTCSDFVTKNLIISDYNGAEFTIAGSTIPFLPVTDFTASIVPVTLGNGTVKKTIKVSWGDRDARRPKSYKRDKYSTVAGVAPFDYWVRVAIFKKDFVNNTIMQKTKQYSLEWNWRTKNYIISDYETIAAKYRVPNDALEGNTGDLTAFNFIPQPNIKTETEYDNDIYYTDSQLEDMKITVTLHKKLDGYEELAPTPKITSITGVNYDDDFVHNTDIDSGSTMYFETSGLQLGSRFLPLIHNLSYNSVNNFFKQKTATPHLLQLALVIPGKPDPDTIIQKYNGTSLVSNSNDWGIVEDWVGGSSLNFNTALQSDSGAAMGQFFVAHVLLGFGEDRIKVTSANGGYTFDTGVLTIANAEPFLDGDPVTTVAQKRSIPGIGYYGFRIQMKDVDGNTTVPATHPSNSFSHYSATNIKDTFSYVNITRQELESGITSKHTGIFMNDHKFETVAQAHFLTEYGHLLRPVVKIGKTSIDLNTVGVGSLDSSTRMYYKKVELALSDCVQTMAEWQADHPHISTSDNWTLEEAVAATQDSKAIIEFYTPASYSSSDNKPNLPPHVKITIENQYDSSHNYETRGSTIAVRHVLGGKGLLHTFSIFDRISISLYSDNTATPDFESGMIAISDFTKTRSYLT